MKLDFTSHKYEDLLRCISKSDYPVIRIKDFLTSNVKPEKYIILRHDVDLNSNEQIYFSELENKYNIASSYYFRVIKGIFDHTVISKVHKLGHEVGYHYETLSKTRGNLELALNLFQKELSLFLRYSDKLTVCPHGGFALAGSNGYTLSGLLDLIMKILSGHEIFSNWKSTDLWIDNSLESFSEHLVGDAHLSIDFEDIFYLSDTGRSWDNKFKNVDLVKSNINVNVKNTDEIIELINSKKFNKLYILVHFEQWKSNFKDWQKWYMSQIIRRNSKIFVKKFFSK